MSDKKNNLEVITVGDIFPQFIGYPEGAQFDVLDDEIGLRIFIDEPTMEEIKQIQSGTPFEMKAFEMKDVLYVLFKFGKLEWMDAPYNAHLSIHLSNPHNLENHNILNIYLFDSSNGKLEAMRVIGLNENIRKQILKAMQGQLAKDFDYMEHGKQISEAYMRYSSKQMAKLASYGFRITE